MNILYSIRHKGRITILMIAVLFLVAFSSYTYNRSINKMGNLFSEMFSDKLIAQDYIHKFQKILYERKLKLTEQKGEYIHGVFTHDKAYILSLLAGYEDTKLTKNEKIQFAEFKTNILSMLAFEEKYISSDKRKDDQDLLKQHNKSIGISLLQLDKLAEIQTTSGKQLNEDSKQIVTFSTLLNQFDWAMIIIIGLIIQVIIFTSRSAVPKGHQKGSLN